MRGPRARQSDTTRRELNRVAAHHAYAHGQARARHKPIQVFLQVASGCNLDCYMCSEHNRPVETRHGRDLTSLSRELYDKIATEIFPLSSTVYIGVGGEPMLAPQFPYFVERAWELGQRVHVMTNGTRIDRPEMAELFARCVAYVQISIDGATQATYERIRLGAKFARMQKNLSLLNEQRLRYPKEERTKLCLCFVLMKSNVHELPLFVEMAARYEAEEVHAHHVIPVTEEGKAEALIDEPERWNEIRAIALERARALGIELDVPKPFPVGDQIDAQPSFAKLGVLPLPHVTPIPSSSSESPGARDGSSASSTTSNGASSSSAMSAEPLSSRTASAHSSNGNGSVGKESANNGSANNSSVGNASVSSASVSDAPVSNGALTNGALTNGALTNGALTNGALSDGAVSSASVGSSTAGKGAVGNATADHGPASSTPRSSLSHATSSSAEHDGFVQAMVPRPPAIACHMPTLETFIFYDGRVFPCCHPYAHEKMQVGDLRTQSFEEIWNGPLYTNLRVGLRTGDVPPICELCSIVHDPPPGPEDPDVIRRGQDLAARYAGRDRAGSDEQPNGASALLVELEKTGIVEHVAALMHERDALLGHSTTIERERDALLGHVDAVERERDALRGHATNLERIVSKTRALWTYRVLGGVKGVFFPKKPV